MSILIIEDDPKVQLFLRESLEPEFSPIFTLSKFPSDLDLAHISSEIETIILDRLLDNVDSKNGISYLRTKFPNASILVLSAINSPSERSELLDLGVDDYMGKPFSLVELKSRIKAIARRSSKQEQTQYVKLDSTILNLHQRSLSVGEQKINLTAKEFELFHLFSRNVGRVFSKFELMDKVWQANLEIESNVLEVNVMNLRRKLIELNSTVQINSRRNIGYWIEI
ncbi:MAG: response regulator transcription factor [Bacteriovoracaceae bacterium]